MTVRSVLVTGGCGYIGSHTTHLLSNSGYKVFVLDNLSTGYRGALLNGEELIECDLSDTDKVKKFFAANSINALIHFAGSIEPNESMSQPLKYYENNFVNSLRLFSTAIEHGTRHILFSSTAAVYGSATKPVTEGFPRNPESPYGRSKLFTEQALADLCASANGYGSVDDDRQVTFGNLRYFNVAGAHPENLLGQRYPNSIHLIKIACEVALGHRSHLDIYGDDYNTRDGSCIRDYIHVQDLAAAHLSVLQYLEGGGESDTFNCGYGKGFTVKEVVASINRVLGKPIAARIAGRRHGDPDEIIAVSDKIRNKTGWTPRYDDIDVIIKHALAWQQSLESGG